MIDGDMQTADNGIEHFKVYQMGAKRREVELADQWKPKELSYASVPLA